MSVQTIHEAALGEICTMTSQLRSQKMKCEMTEIFWYMERMVSLAGMTSLIMKIRS